MATATTRTPTPLRAIRARCLDCVGGEGHHVRVRRCTIDDCPLYDLRTGHGSRAVLGVIRRYCLDCCCGSYHEVRECPAEACTLHAYRSGHRPKVQTSPLSDSLPATGASSGSGGPDRDTRTGDGEKEVAA